MDMVQQLSNLVPAWLGLATVRPGHPPAGCRPPVAPPRLDPGNTAFVHSCWWQEWVRERRVPWRVLHFEVKEKEVCGQINQAAGLRFFFSPRGCALEIRVCVLTGFDTLDAIAYPQKHKCANRRRRGIPISIWFL